MPRLVDTLRNILEAERLADRLRRQHRGGALKALAREQARAGWPQARTALVRRALEGRDLPAARPVRRSRGRLPLTVALGAALAGALATAAAAAPGGGPIQTGARACLTLLQGAQPSAVADLKSWRLDGGLFTAAGKPVVHLAPPGGSNPNVCMLLVEHGRGDQEQVLAALEGWTADAQLGFQKVRDREATSAERTTTTWVSQAGGAEHIVVLSKPVDGPGETVESTVLVTRR